MSAERWMDGPAVAYDCESTSADPFAARIVSAAVVAKGCPPEEWLAAVEVDIPAEAEAVHGISTERARAEGEPPKLVVDQIIESLYLEIRNGAALVIMNAPYDLTVADRECARYGLPTLAERLGRPVSPVIDPLAIDRAVDRYRSGKRTLDALAAHYGVSLTDAHTAGADATAALQVALAIAARWPQARCSAAELHARQVRWYADWAAGFEAHLRKGKDPAAVIDRSWPVKALPPEVAS